jgi:AcrR family transcriptional regulator
LLGATARILSRDGYDHASTNRIAEEAGVSPGSLYQYFPGKEALVAALIDRHRDRMNAVFVENVAAFADAPLADAVAGVVRATLKAQAADPELHRVLIDQVPRVGRLTQLLDDLDTHIAEVVRGALVRRAAQLRVTDVEMAAFVVIHAVQTLSHRLLLLPSHRRERGIEEIIVMVTRYLVDDAAPSKARDSEQK